jgi:hypothetical protein
VPVKKNTFKKWHKDGNLLLLDAGNGVLDIVLSRLNNIEVDWKSEGRNVSVPSVDGKQYSVFMFSNGCDEFVLVVDNMQGSDYSREYFNRENKQHITIYVVNG